MADIAKVKRNVAKMASMNAPEEDIDGYIASEGLTVDDIRNFKGGRNVKDIPESEFVPKNPIVEGLKQTGSQIGDSFVNLAKGIVEPVDRAVVAYPQQIVKALVTGKKEPVETLFAGKVDYPKSSLQVAGDVAGTALLVPGVSAALGKAVVTPFKWVKKAFVGGHKAKQAATIAKENIIDTVSQEVSRIKSDGYVKKKIVSKLAVKQGQLLDNEANSLANALDSAEKTYKGMVADTSFTKTKEVRKALPKLFKEKSAEYGNGLNKILNERPIVATNTEVIPVLEDSLMSHGILGIDDAGKTIVQRSAVTKAESQILKEYFRLKNLPLDSTINTSELLQSTSLIKPKYGKVWGTSEHLQSQVSEGLSSIVAQKSPEVAAYRKAYAPFLEWKKAAIKEFQPFAGKYANKKGSQILSKFGDVNKTLTQDEVKLVSEMEKQLGLDITNKLKSARSIGREIASRKNNLGIQGKVRGQELRDAVALKKSAIDDTIAVRVRSLEDQMDLDISKIDEETRQIIDALHRRKVIIGAAAAATAGPAFIKYIKNRLSYGIFGITGE